MPFLLSVALIAATVYWLTTRRTEDARRMPQSRLRRFQHVGDLPMGCTGHVDASSVLVDADDTCYLSPNGVVSDGEPSDLTVRREPAGYVLRIGPGPVRFDPRPIQWAVRQGLIRVARVEECLPEQPPPAPIHAEETCDEGPGGDLAFETESLDHWSGSFSPWAEPSYQTVPLADYRLEWQTLAAGLFDSVSRRVGGTKAKKYKGSFSVLAASGSGTAAKILIYQSNRGKTCGNWPEIPDGVYVLVRTSGAIGEAIWGTLSGRLDLIEEIDHDKTIGIAPKHSERFAYFRFASTSSVEEISALIATCATSA